MGFVLSLFKKEENYEKVLEQIDQQIQKLQVRLKRYQVNYRTNVIRLLVVTLIFEISYLAYWKFFLHVTTPLENYLWASPLFLALLLAYVFKRFINQYYAYRSNNDTLKLEELQKQQEEKLEEFKAKINFSHVENVINRFDRRKSALPNIPPNVGTPTRPGPGPNTPTRPGPGPNPQMPQQPNMPVNPVQQPQQPQPQMPQIRPQIPGTSPAPAPAPHVPGPIMGPKVPAGVVFAPEQVNSNADDNKDRGMMDKLLDFFVGDSPSKSFALICKKCKAHNGLAPIEEMDSIQFICGACGHLNDFRKEPPNKPAATNAAAPSNTATSNNNNNNNNTNSSNNNASTTSSSAPSDEKKEK